MKYSMEQYIKKSAVVANIEGKKRKISPNADWHFDEYAEGYVDALKDILNFLDTLEVKEVDLDKEFEQFLDEVEGVPRMWHSDEQIEWAKDIAKHFFEFGLKTQK